MLEIRTDISSLTKDQREQLAGFILTFDMPRQAELPFTNKFDPTPQENASAEQFFSGAMRPLSEIVNIHVDLPIPSPEAVFGGQYDSATGSQIVEVKSNHASLNSDGTITVSVAPPPPPAVISPAGPHLVIGSVAVDKSGLPWDERIHSSSKNLTAEGLWRKKRGVGEKTVAEPLTNAQLSDHVGKALSEPLAPPPPPAIPAISTEGKAMYIKLIGDTTAAVGAKKATQEDFKSIALAHGVPSIPLLIQHLDKIQAVADDCYALIASRG